MSLLADRRGTSELDAPAVPDLHDRDRSGCSIELRCDPACSKIVVEGVLDIWSLGALDAQLDQLTNSSSEHLTIDLRKVSDIDREVIRALGDYARSPAVGDGRLSIQCDRGPIAGWLYSAGIHLVARLECP